MGLGRHWGHPEVTQSEDKRLNTGKQPGRLMSIWVEGGKAGWCEPQRRRAFSV